MTPRLRKQVLLVIAAGTIIRLIVVFTSRGVDFDIDSWRKMFFALRDHRFGAYDHIIPGNFPYPPGYTPWIAFAGELSRVIPFERAVRLGAVIADIGIAFLVRDLVARAGGSERRQLIATALIALGPLSIGVAGFNGQLDPAATFFALLAYRMWIGGRVGWTGALLGVAGAVKTVPLILVWPVAWAARTRNEGLRVIAAAVAAFVVICLPFAIGSSHLVSTMTGYQGLPGFGGISLLVQPRFAAHVLHGEPNVVGNFDTLVWLRDHATVVLIPALALMAAMIAWRRPDALTGICLMYLTVYVFGVNFFVSYLVWIIPFLIVRGHLRAAAVLQFGIAIPQITVFFGYHPIALWWAWLGYTAVMITLWLWGAGVLGAATVRSARWSSSAPRSA